jgi:hypothetical protein
LKFVALTFASAFVATNRINYPKYRTASKRMPRLKQQLTVHSRFLGKASYRFNLRLAEESHRLSKVSHRFKTDISSREALTGK